MMLHSASVLQTPCRRALMLHASLLGGPRARTAHGCGWRRCLSRSAPGEAPRERLASLVAQARGSRALQELLAQRDEEPEEPADLVPVGACGAQCTCRHMWTARLGWPAGWHVYTCRSAAALGTWPAAGPPPMPTACARGSRPAPALSHRPAAATKIEWESPLRILQYPDPRLRAPNARVGGGYARMPGRTGSAHRRAESGGGGQAALKPVYARCRLGGAVHGSGAACACGAAC